MHGEGLAGASQDQDWHGDAKVPENPCCVHEEGMEGIEQHPQSRLEPCTRCNVRYRGSGQSHKLKSLAVALQ